MTDFFNSEEKVLGLMEVAESWVGTPFMFAGKEKGRGVSCQMLPWAIYRECGLDLAWTPPLRTAGGQDEDKARRVSEFIEATGQFARVPLGGINDFTMLRAGDLLTFEVLRAEYHLGLFLDVRQLKFIHTIKEYGTSVSNLFDPTYGEKILGAWRPQV